MIMSSSIPDISVEPVTLSSRLEASTAVSVKHAFLDMTTTAPG
jgi:hypothetical protein